MRTQSVFQIYSFGNNCNLSVAPNIVLAGFSSRAIPTVFLDLDGPEHVTACPI